MDPVTLTTLAIAVTAGSTGLSVYQAQQANQAAKKSVQSAREAATVQNRQTADQAEQRRLRRIAELQRLEGAIRVAQADSGVGYGGSYTRMADAAIATARIDTQVIGRNAAMQAESVNSQLRARVADITSRQVSPLVAGFQGFLQGASAGLSIYSMGTQLAQGAGEGAAGTLFQFDGAAPITSPPIDIGGGVLAPVNAGSIT